MYSLWYIVVTQMWAMGPAWRERETGGDPPKTRFLRPVDAIIPGKQNSVHLYSHFNRKRDLTTSSTRAGLPYWLGA